MKMNLKKTACMLAALTVVGSATAQPFRLAGGHADINLEFDGTELEIGFHTEFTDGHTQITGGAPQQNEFEAADLVVAVPVGTTTIRPAGTEFDPIGVPVGQRINVMPQTEAGSESAGVVFLGWSAGELTASDWSGDLTWTLVGVSGPGTFSAYESGLTPTFRMASSDGVSAADSFTIEAGHHEHFNLGFSSPGTYQIQVAVSGIHNTAGVVGTTNTLTFDVAALPFVLEGGHADVNLEFDGTELEIGFHTEFTDGHTQITGGAPQQNEFEAADLVVAVPVGTTTIRPAGTGFDPIGVPAGQRISVMPETEAGSEAAGVVRLGWGAEELTAADWTGDLLWTLVGVSGPGAFSAYKSGLTPSFRMASADGISAADMFMLEAGHHEHFNLGFSAPGVYQIQLAVTGTHNTAGVVSATNTLTFHVEARPFRLTGGHADVNLEYDVAEGLEIGFHTEFTDGHTQITGGAPQQNEFEAADLVVAVPVGTTTIRPAGTGFDPIGVPAGQRINVMPQTEPASEAAGVVRLGWGAEELVAADWTGDLTWTLVGVSGPGAISVYESGLTPTFRMASSDGLSAADTFTLEAGHHEHFNLGFSAPGLYQIQLAVSGVHKTAGLRSTVSTLTFEVMARPFQLTGGHADVNLELDGNQFEIGFHTEFTDGHTQITGGASQQNEFPAEELEVVVPGATLIARPSGAEWGATGAGAGEDLFVLPQTEVASENTGAVFLGWAAEELTAGDWTSDITWTLTGATGPGHFSVYESGLTPTFRMSTADGVSAADSFTIEAGHHEHFNLGFTQPGSYRLGFSVAGTHATLGQVTGAGTLTFVVQAPPVPAAINAPAFATNLPLAVLGADGSLVLSIPAGAVSGDGLMYQWQRNGVDIPGATGAILNATEASPGTYRVVVTGATGPAVPSPDIPVLRVTSVFVAGAKVEGPTAGLNLLLESADAIKAPTIFAPVNGAQAVPDGEVLRLLDVNRDPSAIGERFFRIGLQMPQP